MATFPGRWHRIASALFMFAIVMGDPQTAQTASASTLRFAAVSLPEAVVALVAYFRVKRCGSISAAVSSSALRGAKQLIGRASM
jgi:uncharacterized membrane protein